MITTAQQPDGLLFGEVRSDDFAAPACVCCMIGFNVFLVVIIIILNEFSYYYLARQYTFVHEELDIFF